MVKHTQKICWQQPTNCLSVLDHFVKLSLKGLKHCSIIALFNPLQNDIKKLNPTLMPAEILNFFTKIWHGDKLVSLIFLMACQSYVFRVDSVYVCSHGTSSIKFWKATVVLGHCISFVQRIGKKKMKYTLTRLGIFFDTFIGKGPALQNFPDKYIYL